MKFKVGDIIFSDYHNKWGFVSKLNCTLNKTKTIAITWFRNGEEMEYTAGSFPYNTFKKSESEDNK